MQCLRRHISERCLPVWSLPDSELLVEWSLLADIHNFYSNTVGCVWKDVSVTKSVCCSCRWSGLWVSAPTLGGSQPPATPLGSNTLWSPQVPACTWHTETHRGTSAHTLKKKINYRKNLVRIYAFLLLSSVPHPLSPGGWQFTVSTLFICVYLGQTAFSTGQAPTSLTSEHEQKYTKYYRFQILRLGWKGPWKALGFVLLNQIFFVNLGAQAQCMVCLGARQCKRPVALFLEEEQFSRMLWNRTHVMVLTLKHSPFTQNQYRVEGKTKVLCQEVKGLLGMLSSASLQG